MFCEYAVDDGFHGEIGEEFGVELLAKRAPLVRALPDHTECQASRPEKALAEGLEELGVELPFCDELLEQATVAAREEARRSLHVREQIGPERARVGHRNLVRHPREECVEGDPILV